MLLRHELQSSHSVRLGSDRYFLLTKKMAFDFSEGPSTPEVVNFGLLGRCSVSFEVPVQPALFG